MNVNDPHDADLARMRELAVAFALSEIDEAGMRELHGLLTGSRGAEMAKAAWQQLDGTVDLRVQLGGPAFAEAVRMRLADDGTFARAAQRRLGTRRSLDPVDAPPARPRRWPRRLAWFAVPMLLAAVVTYVLLRTMPPATVTAIVGLPVAAGVALVPGVGLDQTAPIAVPPGAALAFTWRDGSAAVVAGPCSAIVQSGGLSLVGGTAWVRSGASGLTLGTPDRRLRLPVGARVAAMVQEGVSVIAVPADGVAVPDAPAPGRLSAQGRDSVWEADRRVSGAIPLPGTWWELELRVDAWMDDGRLLIALEPGPGLTLTPTTLQLPGGRVARLGGAPADARHLLLRMHGRQGEVTIDGIGMHELLLDEIPNALRIERSGATGSEPELRVGPPHQPPLPLQGW
jgi:hypothetical protein